MSHIEVLKQALEALEENVKAINDIEYADCFDDTTAKRFHNVRADSLWSITSIRAAIASYSQAIAETEKREALERKTEDHDVDCLCSDCFALDNEVLGFNGWGFPIQKPEAEKERCFGCEACIDTACGRKECPKGWSKAEKQEPVAWCEQSELDWLNSDKRGASAYVKTMLSKRKDGLALTPLYTSPPQRQPLTDEQIAHATAPVFMGGNPSLTGIARAIEAAHGIKGEA